MGTFLNVQRLYKSPSGCPKGTLKQDVPRKIYEETSINMMPGSMSVQKVTGPVQPGYSIAASRYIPSNYLQENRGPYVIDKVSTSANSSVSMSIPEEAEPEQSLPHPEVLGASFSSTSIRHRFIRKVYAIVTLELIVTFAIVALFSTNAAVKEFVQKHVWMTITAYCIFLVTYLTLVCCGEIRRKWPSNIILLALFTLSMSYVLGTISAFYDTEVVFFAIGVTAILSFLITVFAVQTKHDFTGCGIYLYVCCWLVVIFGILACIMQDRAMQMLYSGGIALLFSFYLVYDTQCIVGHGKMQLSEEEHIFGALILYYDVVMIFLAIVGLSKD